MSNPYRYETGFTIEQHVEELIDRLGKAIKRINELESASSTAAQPVVAGGAELCRTCGANCIIWFTDNALWNKYGKFGILCVSCFVKKAEEMGFECTGWKLSPEGWTERLFPTTHDGDRKEP